MSFPNLKRKQQAILWSIYDYYIHIHIYIICKIDLKYINTYVYHMASENSLINSYSKYCSAVLTATIPECFTVIAFFTIHWIFSEHQIKAIS